MFTAQNFCGAKRIRAPFAPPRLSDPRKVEAEAHAVATNSDTVKPEEIIFDFNAAISEASINLWVTAGIGSCHIKTSAGTSAPT